MGLWAYRLGTRDAAEVPIIRAMEGPTRIQPEDPGGLRAAHQGLEVNSVLAGRPADAAETRAAAPLTRQRRRCSPPRTAPQGELVHRRPRAAGRRRDGGRRPTLTMPLADDARRSRRGRGPRR